MPTAGALSLDGSELATAPTPTVAASPPEWSAISETIRCPLCGYDLRGLTVARCPECGGRFEWTQLLDPNSRLHPYLFEHHPERNIWSFVRTVLGGLNPWRFWTTLQPQQPSSRTRLFVYWFVASMLTVMVLSPWYVDVLQGCVRSNIWERARYTRAYRANPTLWLQGKPSLQAFLDDQFPLWGNARLYAQAWQALTGPGGAGGDRSLMLLSAWVAWPWASAGVFLLLRSSMRAARLRVEHALRVTLYSFDAMALAV